MLPRLLVLALLGAVPVAARAGDALDASSLRAMETLGAKWWKARPKTAFEEWAPEVRRALLAEAARIGKIPEGSLGRVKDALWKSVKANGPKGSGRDKLTVATPYGEAWCYVKGAGRDKGLVLGLHGGGAGAGSADEAAGAWSAKNCMGMYPQGIRLVDDTWNTVHGEKFILTLIEIAKAQHDIDPDRVYTMGFSMGGTGSWFMAGRHADLLAGSMPCAGVIMASPKAQLKRKEDVVEIQHGLIPNVRNLAMYYFIGVEDTNCMPGTYLFAWDRLQEWRAKDPTGYQNVRFLTIPGLRHAFPPGEPKTGIQWIERQRRLALPERVVWESVLDPYPLPDAKDQTNRAPKRWFYWLQHGAPKEQMLVQATRKGNEIDVSVSQGDPSGLTILLNPEMIDVTKEVIVRVDGKEAYRGKPEPDFTTVLETLDARLDRTLTFDRRISLAGLDSRTDK